MFSGLLKVKIKNLICNYNLNVCAIFCSIVITIYDSQCLILQFIKNCISASKLTAIKAETLGQKFMNLKRMSKKRINCFHRDINETSESLLKGSNICSDKCIHGKLNLITKESLGSKGPIGVKNYRIDVK